MAASATFALKAGVWFRRGRLIMVSPDSQATACPPSGRNSTYRPVQISGASSLADNSDLWIGETQLNVAHVQDHEPVRSERRIVRRSAEVGRLRGVQTCAVVVGADVVGPAITGELPVEEPLGIVRV